MSQPSGAALCRNPSCPTAGLSERNLVEIRAVTFQELKRGELDAWSRLQRMSPEFESPFFRPEFSALLAEYQPDIEVAVLRTTDRCVGFWPFQRGRGNVAYSDGSALRSYEGVVCDPAISWSPKDLLEGCRLSAWKFNHLVVSQSGLRPFHWRLWPSPVIDLPSGLDNYLDRKRRERSHTIQLVLRKRRRVERDVGRIRFVPMCDDDCVLDMIIEWKRAQFARICSVDHLAPAWRRAFLKRVAAFRSEDFSGMTSALYAGRHLLAAHFGLRSRGVLHGWLPVFNRCFQQYSPGIMLWATLAESAPALGITRIDLGMGQEHYKDRLKTSDVTVAEGVFDPWFVSRTLREGWWHTRRAILASPLGRPLRRLLRLCRGLRGYEVELQQVGLPSRCQNQSLDCIPIGIADDR